MKSAAGRDGKDAFAADDTDSAALHAPARADAEMHAVLDELALLHALRTAFE